MDPIGIEPLIGPSPEALPSTLHATLRGALSRRDMARSSVDVVVIGAGPGGYTAAIRCAQFGLSTVVVDGRRPGGECLHVGCIPSKAMIHVADQFRPLVSTRQVAESPLARLGIDVSGVVLDFGQAVRWKDSIVDRLSRGVSGLLRRAGVEVVAGRAEIVDGKTVDVVNQLGLATRFSAQHLVLATGAQPVALPHVPFGGPVVSSTELLSLSSVPETLTVVGGGYIGVELATVMAKLGVRVTLIEREPRVLPGFSPGLTAPVHSQLECLGVEVMTGTVVKKAEGSTLTVDVVDHGQASQASGSDRSDQAYGSSTESTDRAPQTVTSELVLMAVGRRPNVAGFGLERLTLDMNDGAIAVDDRGRTSMRNVWALGDVTGEPMLAHRATRHGEIVAATITGRRPPPMAPVPAVAYSDPEVVSVGLRAEQAEAQAQPVDSATFPFTASGRAATIGHDAGFVEVVASANDGTVVGIHAVGRGVAELSSAFSLAVHHRMTVEDVAHTVYPHPTLGEGLGEAALRTLGLPLHI